MILVENTGSATPSWCVFARSQSVLFNSSFSGGHCISGSSQPFYVHLYGCFLKWWYLQIIHFNRVFHYKPSILGYHYFRKHPYIIPLHSFLPSGSVCVSICPLSLEVKAMISAYIWQRSRNLDDWNETFNGQQEILRKRRFKGNPKKCSNFCLARIMKAKRIRYCLWVLYSHHFFPSKTVAGVGNEGWIEINRFHFAHWPSSNLDLAVLRTRSSCISFSSWKPASEAPKLRRILDVQAYFLLSSP